MNSQNEQEQLGTFSGYIRRPTPTSFGMTAQIFGENGEDADTILALSLSKYQDMEVFVNIYLIKDEIGRIMKKDDAYPLISSFNGFVRRSLPKKDGMVAQFFAPNGESADSVSELSKSSYQDCLVFVDVRQDVKKKEKYIDLQNYKSIDDIYANKMTKKEREVLEEMEKQFKKINELLEISDFLLKIEVVSSIGQPVEFQEWLDKTQPCSFLMQQGQSCKMNCSHHQVNGLFSKFNFIPLCDEHKAAFTAQHLEENDVYYDMKHRLLLKKWVLVKLKEKFSHDGKSEANPQRVLQWAIEKKIDKYLPEKYKKLAI